jgi:hypothetical protein
MPIRISQEPPVIAESTADALNRDLPLSKFVANQVRLIFSPEVEGIADAGMGTLYITTKNIIFYNSNQCINIDYPTITIHAISRGDNDRLVRKPCIYCQLDLPIQDQGDGVDIVPEMRLVPNDDTCLDDLFLSLNECAALNPDAMDDQAFDDMEEPFQGVSTSGLSAQGVRNMQHIENLLQQSLDQQESSLDRKESDESEVVDR